MAETTVLQTNSEEGERRRAHAASVREMFAGIASRYDLLNHLLSANVDRRWRARVVARVRGHLTTGARALDIACGTGDLSLALAEGGDARVTGLDFCRPMLDLAARKSRERGREEIVYVEGDALRLPFADATFDAVTIAFGLRNLADYEGGLRELLRVTRVGGRMCVLEFSQPVVPGLRALFRFYFTRVLPRVGGWLSGSRGAYEYLPDSVARFPDQRRLAELMRAVGFEEVEFENLTGGIAALHTGTRSPRAR